MEQRSTQPDSTQHRHRIGDRVRITNVGCDCEPYSNDVCYRHALVGDIVTITGYEAGHGWIIDADDFDYWYDDELEAVQ